MSGGTERPLAEVRFLTVAEVASLMRVSKMTVYRLVHAGELPAVRVGRSFRVPEQAVHDSYLETCRRLPEDARRCVVPGYVANHADTCESVLQQEDVRGGVAELRALVAISS